MSKITKQAVKHTGRLRKEQIVAEIVEKLDSSNGLVFADFQGLNHQQIESLKKELKTVDSTIVIAKNSLLKISLSQSKNYADFKDNEGLNLPTATLIIRGDMVEPLKKLQKMVKESGLPKIKFAILEGNLADESGVLKIASLPNRDTLIAQFVGTLNSPIQGLVVTLNGTIQKFVMTLGAVAAARPSSVVVEDNGGQAKPATAESAAPAETPAPEAEAAPTETETPSETPETSEEKAENVSNNTADVSAEEAETNETENQSDDSKGGEN